MGIPVVSSLVSLTASIILGAVKSILTETVIRKLLILLGDEIVKRTPNDTDNKVWAVLKEALENRLDGIDTPLDKEKINSIIS